MLRLKFEPSTAKGWKRFVRDEVILTVGAIILVFWFTGACTRVTGFTYAKRKGFFHASPSQIADFWHLPALMTIVWTPIIIWRVWKIRK